MHMDIKPMLAIKCRGEKQAHAAQRWLGKGVNAFLSLHLSPTGRLSLYPKSGLSCLLDAHL